MVEQKEQQQLSMKRLISLVDKVFDSTEYQDRREKFSRYLKEFTGEWWKEENLAATDSRVFVNFLFSTIQSAAPMLTDNRPIWNVIARLGFLQKVANIYSLGLGYLWDKMEMDRKVYLAVIDALLFGTALAKASFDPEEDDVTTDIIDPSTFVITPGYDDEWKAPWMGTVTYTPYSWVVHNHPDLAPTIQPTRKNEDEDLTETIEYQLVGADYVKLYELWIKDGATEAYMTTEVIEKDGKEIEQQVKKYREKYPFGRIILTTDKGVVLEDKPSPFRHGKPPYVRLVDYDIPHHFWGLGEPDQIETLNLEMNLRLQQAVEHARKNTKVNWLGATDNGVSTAVWKKAITEGDQLITVKTDFVKDSIIPMATPPLNRVVTDLLNVFPRYIEEVTGVTETSKGQVSKKQRQSAFEMQALLDSGYTRIRQKVRNLEHFVKRLCTLHLELMQQFYTEAHPIAFKESDGVSQQMISNRPKDLIRHTMPDVPMEIPTEDLDDADKQEREDYEKMIAAFGEDDEVYAQFDIQIETNSTLPTDYQAMANLALRLADMGVLDPISVLEAVRWPGIERVKKRMEERDKQQAGGPQGPPPAPQGGKGPVPGAAEAQLAAMGGM